MVKVSSDLGVEEIFAHVYACMVSKILMNAFLQNMEKFKFTKSLREL